MLFEFRIRILVCILFWRETKNKKIKKNSRAAIRNPSHQDLTMETTLQSQQQSVVPNGTGTVRPMKFKSCPLSY